MISGLRSTLGWFSCNPHGMFTEPDVFATVEVWFGRLVNQCRERRVAGAGRLCPHAPSRRMSRSGQLVRGSGARRLQFGVVVQLFDEFRAGQLNGRQWCPKLMRGCRHNAAQVGEFLFSRQGELRRSQSIRH